MGQLLGVGVTASFGSRSWEHSCSRLGTARRCEPPPAPRVPTSEERGGAAPLTGRGPRGRPKEHMLVADWGSAGMVRHAGRTVAQAVRRHILPRKKRLGRRRFAPAQPGSEYSRFVGRRDGNAADTRPRAGEVFTGEEQLPYALCRPVSGSSDTPNSCLVGEVCWVLPLGSTVFFVGSYTEVEPAQASGSPTVAWGAGRTNGGRPSHEEHARRQTRRIPGPHPH